MADRIYIEKIQNGYVVGVHYFFSEKLKDVYFSTIEEALEHLRMIFGGGKYEGTNSSSNTTITNGRS